MNKSKVKHIVKDTLDSMGPTTSFSKIVETHQVNLLKLQELKDKSKKLAAIYLGESDVTNKEKLKSVLIEHSKIVKNQQKIVNESEADCDRVIHSEPVQLGEIVISEEIFKQITE